MRFHALRGLRHTQIRQQQLMQRGDFYLERFGANEELGVQVSVK